MSMIFRRLTSAVPLAATLGLGAVMLAGSGLASPTPVPDEVVQYNDLDTTTAVGVQELASRIQTAAWQACLVAVPPSSTGPSQIANFKCQQDVIKQTVDQINIPALNEMFPNADNADVVSD
jgi:UrcA family protein